MTKKSMRIRLCTLCVVAILLFGAISLMTILGSSPAIAATSKSTGNWALVLQNGKEYKDVTYSGEKYRVYLYKDTAFEKETTLFTATPVYHDGKTDVTYTVTIEVKTSVTLSEAIGVSVSSEVEAFGNGVHASLGISTSVANSYTISSQSGGIMHLTGENEAGFYSICGYEEFVHYKIVVQKYTYKKIGEHQESYKVTETRKEGCKTVSVTVTKYRTVVDYGWVWEDCKKFSGELITYANPETAGVPKLKSTRLG